MASIADNGGAQEPLGSVLVKHGLITPEQLTDALARQRTSGKPLGAIVVELGFATPASIGQALATQHGGLLKTEYGFATGFGAGGLATAVAIEAPPVSGPAPPFDPGKGHEAIRAELSVAAAETERLSDANERLAEARAELEQRLAHATRRIAALEHELAERRSAEVAPPALARWEDAQRHLVFFQGVEGYELLERDGPPPAEGAHVDGQLVVRVASAPFPGSELPCAYLALS